VQQDTWITNRDSRNDMTVNGPVKIVVLGGGYAGVLAALRLAGKTRRANVHITLINGSEHFVERIRLHQLATDQPLRSRPFARLLAGTGIEFIHGWATAIDPARRAVTVQQAHNHARHDTESVCHVPYDHLIYAVGSTVDRHSVPGVAEHAHALGGEAAARALQQATAALADGARILVVGGGWTGIEAATELAETHPHLHVTLATRGALGENLSRRGAAHLRTVCATLGIRVLEHTSITRIEPQRALCADGSADECSVPFDLCVWAGAFTVPDLARRSGLATDAGGRVQVDAGLRSLSHPAVYAIGDAAATPLRMACATAMPMGAYIADQLAAQLNDAPTVHAESTDKASEPFRYAHALQCISLGRRQALVQFVRADDFPKERILTGWLAVGVKELICRATIWMLQLEKRFPGLYMWPQADLAPAARPEIEAVETTQTAMNTQDLAYEQRSTD